MAPDLKTTMERNIKALALRPAIGRGTATTKVRIRSGLTCDIDDGAWKLIADEPPSNGGAGLGPDPGVLVRAGLGSCLAIGYAQWAAVLGLTLEDVEVTVETDYDARGMYGIDAAMAPGWGAVRYRIAIASSAPEAQVRELAELADRRSPILDDLRRSVPIARELHIGPAAG